MAALVLRICAVGPWGKKLIVRPSLLTGSDVLWLWRSLQSYGYTLNIKSKKGLFQMKLVSAFTATVMVWTRLVRYVWLAWQLVDMLYNDGAMYA